MQDDVTDATLWAISEGITDSESVCIFGASYGGYASLRSTRDDIICSIPKIVFASAQLFQSSSWQSALLSGAPANKPLHY